ncbi:MAG: ABC transporter ATP-binding protein [Anaerolineales bacterium]|nr:ABC transporter ATP-binding protein [Anaerolineales bacterium]
MNAIETHELSRDFGTVKAVDRITFSAAAGELFGFLGPNGAGKTTTIRILTGQLRPTSGSAKVAGYDAVTERAELKRRIGVVFEYQNLYERMSAIENLHFIADLYGASRKRVAQVLEQVGLAERACEPIKRFSNGMKQRLLIARALIPRPQVLFLDEPTRGLDPAVARDVRSIIAGLARSGTTVFLTTHYMEEADRLCARVAILDRGRIVAMDAPAALKAAHGGPQGTLEDVFLKLTGSPMPVEPQ